MNHYTRVTVLNNEIASIAREFVIFNFTHGITAQRDHFVDVSKMVRHIESSGIFRKRYHFVNVNKMIKGYQFGG